MKKEKRKKMKKTFESTPKEPLPDMTDERYVVYDPARRWKEDRATFTVHWTVSEQNEWQRAMDAARLVIKTALIRAGLYLPQTAYVLVQLSKPWAHATITWVEGPEIAAKETGRTIHAGPVFMGSALASSEDRKQFDPAVGACIAAERAVEKLVEWLKGEQG